MQRIPLDQINDIERVLQILRRYKFTYGVLNFNYSTDSENLIIENDQYDEDLQLFKQQYRLITVYEAEQFITKCIMAARYVALSDIFLGGYCLDDFCLIYKGLDYEVKIKVKADKIVNFINNSIQFEYLDAPELKIGIITEKADFWSFGKCFMELVKINSNQLLNKQQTLEDLLECLDIQDLRLLQLLKSMIDIDYKKRLTYSQFKRLYIDGLVQITSINSKYIGQTQICPSFDALLKQRKLTTIKQLGEGSFGTVDLVENELGEQFAAKFIKVQNQRQMNKASSEMIAMFKNLQSEYVINILYAHKVFIKFDCYVLVQQEYASNGDMRNFMFKYSNQLTNKHKLKFFYDISCALVAIKKQEIIHRDLKPDNILISENFTAKLSDFGCNQLTINTQSQSSFQGTLGYIAPEVITSGNISFQVDVWSFGIMLREYCKDSPLIKDCLQENPQNRISIEQIQLELSIYKNAKFNIELCDDSDSMVSFADDFSFTNILEDKFSFNDYSLNLEASQ
eukprot:EST47815.1 Kinase, ULK [Spironucleus salmonicida]